MTREQAFLFRFASSPCPSLARWTCFHRNFLAVRPLSSTLSRPPSPKLQLHDRPRVPVAHERVLRGPLLRRHLKKQGGARGGESDVTEERRTTAATTTATAKREVAQLLAPFTEKNVDCWVLCVELARVHRRARALSESKEKNRQRCGVGETEWLPLLEKKKPSGQELLSLSACSFLQSSSLSRRIFLFAIFTCS